MSPEKAATSAHDRNVGIVTGDTMYNWLIESDSAIALILAFVVVLVTIGTVARALRWLATARANDARNA